MRLLYGFMFMQPTGESSLFVLVESTTLPDAMESAVDLLDRHGYEVSDLSLEQTTEYGDVEDSESREKAFEFAAQWEGCNRPTFFGFDPGVREVSS